MIKHPCLSTPRTKATLFYSPEKTDCSFFPCKDLVNEKLKTQQMNNDLEKLSHELEKIGLNKERLLHDEQSSDDRWEWLGCLAQRINEGLFYS